MPEAIALTAEPNFVGTWILESYTEQTAHAEPVQPFGPNPVGLLIYTVDGMVSAQLMRPRRAELKAGAWDFVHAEGLADLAAGYIAYSGRYYVDQTKQEIIHTPVVALIPNLIGHPQHRRYTLNGRTLVLQTSNSGPAGELSETRLVWRQADLES